MKLVALDMGFGNIKAICDGNYVIFRSATASGSVVNGYGLGKDADDKPTNISFEEMNYMVGGRLEEYTSGDIEQSQELSRFESRLDILPLVYRAITELNLGNGEEIILGTSMLLALYLLGSTERQRVSQVLSQILLGEHVFTTTERSRKVEKRVTISQVIMEHPQPYYGLFSQYTTRDGQVIENHELDPNKRAIVAVSIGNGTVEIMPIHGRILLGRLRGYPQDGVNKAVTMLAAKIYENYGVMVRETRCNELLVGRFFPHRVIAPNIVPVGSENKDILSIINQVVNNYVNTTMKIILQGIGDLRGSFRPVLMGGGAYLLANRMKRQFHDVYMPSVPERAVVDGIMNSLIKKAGRDGYQSTS